MAGEAGRAALVAAEGRIVAASEESEERIRTLEVSMCLYIYIYMHIDRERRRDVYVCVNR